LVEDVLYPQFHLSRCNSRLQGGILGNMLYHDLFGHYLTTKDDG
jgi:hypothetical protein